MGRVKNLLFNKTLKPQTDWWSDMYSIEICEDFHIHWRNTRLQYSLSEWIHFTDAIIHSRHYWEQMGRKLPHPSQTLPTYLHTPGAQHVTPLQDISGDNFRIEDDDLNSPSIHVHYRSLRLDLSHPEFLELAAGFTEAAKKLREIHDE